MPPPPSHALSVALRPPAPVPSPAHGRFPPSPPSSSPSDSTPAPPLPPTEDDWYLYPAPTRFSAKSLVPPVDVKKVLEKRRARRKAGGKGEGEGEGGLGRKEHKMLGEWRVGESLGKGTSGHVRLARNTRTGEHAAIKKVRRLPDGDKHAKSVHREISLMKLASPHPHLVELLDVFETTTHLYLVQEYLPDGELFHLIVKRQLMPEEIHRFYTQLISALQHLSTLSLCHRDVKFENLLLFADPLVGGEPSLKLSDMGMASFQPEGEWLKTSCGSPHYAAPEVIRGDPYTGSLADVWSSGIVLFAMFARRLPFDDENIPTLLDKIKHDGYEMHESITGDARDLVERCLRKDTGRRIGLNAILKHPYVRSPPFPTAPLARAAKNPHKPVEDSSIAFADGQLDEALVEVGRSRLFYSILSSFRQPRQPRTLESATEQDGGSIHVGDESLPSTLAATVSMTSIRRSMSAPDLNIFPIPLDGDAFSTGEALPDLPLPTSPARPSDFAATREGTIDERPLSVNDETWRLINERYAFPPPSFGNPRPRPLSTLNVPIITSAPPHIESFALQPLPVSPIDPAFAAPSFHVALNSRRGGRKSRPGTANTAATRSLPTSPLLNSDPTFAAAAAEAEQRARPSVDSRRLSGMSSLLFRAPSKKASMQQRLRSLFLGGGGAGGTKRASVSSVVEEKNEKKQDEMVTLHRGGPFSPPPSLPLPPLPSAPLPPLPAVPTVRPPSPSPSRASSMLKRSSAYRSFGRALNGKPPQSPELTEFGELLSLGASASKEARAEHNAVERGKTARKEKREKEKVREREEEKIQVYQDAKTGRSKPVVTPTPAHSPSKRKTKRPLPLAIEKSNTLAPVPLAFPGPPPSSAASNKSIRKPPSILGLGRPPRRPSPHPQQPPSLRLRVVDENSPLPVHSPSSFSSATSPRPIPDPTSPDSSDPEDPFSLISALKQYPYRSASHGSTRGAGSLCSSSRSRAPSASNYSFRIASGSTAPTTTHGGTLSARSPRIGEDDDYPPPPPSFLSSSQLSSHSHSHDPTSSQSAYSTSYASSLLRLRTLESELRKTQLENKLLVAAVEARDDELAFLRRSESRLSRCLQSGEEVVQELTREREELEEMVRGLEWEKHRSFFDWEGEGAGEERSAGEGEGEAEEEGRGELRVRNRVAGDEWLQSLRGQR
ncbi:hypothetical protein JCM8547_005922 [Rhodosporidiobolus lusitaniae]